MSPTARSNISSNPSSSSIIYEAVPEPYDPSPATPRSSSCDSGSSGRSTFDLCSELENGNCEAAEGSTASSTAPSTPTAASTPTAPSTLSFSKFFVPEWIKTTACVIGIGLAVLASVVLGITFAIVVGSWVIDLIDGALGVLGKLGILPNMAEGTAEAASTVAEAVAQATEAAVVG